MSEPTTETERLRAVLTLIASYNGQTLFSSDPGYREGAAHAFATLAEIARQAVEDTP